MKGNEKASFQFLYGITFGTDPYLLTTSSAAATTSSFVLFPFISSMDSKQIHPALTVSNIKTHIPLLLEKDSSHFNTWKTLFQVHCQAYEVADHLLPRPAPAPATLPSDPAAAALAEAQAAVADQFWNRVDALVKQWIYATVSQPLLRIIIQPTQTAHDAWLAVEREFNDNKNTRAIFLGQEFANLSLENFSSMGDYCDHAKHLADQLDSVGSPVDNRMLVLQVLTGLTEQYDSISTVLQNRDPLPSFPEVRSCLNLEESKKKRQLSRVSSTAATALLTSNSSHSTGPSQSSNTSPSKTSSNRPRNNRGRGRGSNRKFRSSAGSQPTPNHPYIVFPNNWTTSQWASVLNNKTGSPPCPYPSRPTSQSSQGILGPRPDQALHTNYSPTDIERALYSLALNPPDHGVMDTGASSHSANKQGIYSPSNFNTCTNKNIVVGNGMSIPVVAQGNQVLPPPYPPLKLNNVLFAPQIIKNLISVRRLTTDNLVSVEFDPFGFLVKDLKTRAPILRCNSTGDLYPLTKPLPIKTSQPSTLVAVSQDRWHQRLGHPGNNLLQSLKLDSFIDYGKLDKTLCQSCVFGKSVKLPFYDSVNSTSFASDGSLERYKARLVCDGRKQQTDIDCGETFSPVVKPSTIRLILFLALSKSWPIHQLDVTNAFLHGNLEETVYMHQPVGFRHKDFPDHVCRLRKSLYGLKQAPRAWHQRFTDFVTTQGFQQCKSDNSLFTYHHGSETAYLLIYVDDIILTTSTNALRIRLIDTLSGEFAMKDLGPLSYFLGVQVTRTGNKMFLSQQAYVKDIIHRAAMDSCKPVATPVDTQSKLSADAGPPHEDPVSFRSLAGALQYLTFTRPDISYAVQQICMHMHDPRQDHWNALKRIIRYLQGTIDHGLHLGPVPNLSLVAYTDADWAGCPDTRRSTSGYCVYLGDNLISWSSKCQSTISRSSAEAEYRGVANVVADICWLRNLLLELRHPLPRATLVYCDNVSAIYLSGNPVQHQRTKHIELDIHFVRELVQRGHIRVLHVPSRHQIADIFTKGLPRVLFDDFRSSLNISPPDVSTAGV
ncbi:uncharacterized protein LOC143563131 [Bidens hawaiensis]|uniref:uncharacterized protein LOC143563131 n=1 Tax=Bidens hawaiensis TaxID=980011 RepID=UPI00404B36D0